MDHPETREQARANYDSVRAELFAYINADSGRRLVDDTDIWGLAFLLAKSGKVQLAALEMAMIEGRDLRLAAERYVEGAEKNRVAAEADRDAQRAALGRAENNARIMTFLTVAIALAAVVQAGAVAAQIIHPAPAPIVHVAPPAVHIAAPTLSLPPITPVQPEPNRNAKGQPQPRQP